MISACCAGPTPPESTAGTRPVRHDDLYANATGEYAHFMLPSTDQFERADVTYAGLGLQHRPHVQFTEAVVPARRECREEWWILARLCRELGFEGPREEGDAPRVFARAERMLERGGVSFEELKNSPGGLLLKANEPGRFFADHIATPEARVDCRPAFFAEALRRLAEDFRDLEREAPGTLRLITKRDRFMHNSWFHNVDGMKRGERAQNYLFMHPSDVERLGLAGGQTVRVRSRAGEIELPLKPDPDLMPGVVAATHGWGHAATELRIARERPGANVNRLLASGPGSYDPLSNMAHMTGSRSRWKRRDEGRPSPLVFSCQVLGARQGADLTVLRRRPPPEWEGLLRRGCGRCRRNGPRSGDGRGRSRRSVRRHR
jgi:anaerobic selenocysteine-containing dehydrogenase